MKTNWAVKALPASVLAVIFASAAGCSSTDPDNCTLKARIDAVTNASSALVSVSAEMQGKLYVACTAIAGLPAVQASAATDDNVQTACAAASAKIKANFAAGATVTYVPGKCEIAADLQASCEASCKSDVMCTEPSIEVRCMPGELSVECDGSCSGTVTCEASASASVACEGSCNGSCEGTCGATCEGSCEGTCMGQCDGKDSTAACAGKCSGTCSGMCKGTCSGSCKGSCKGSCTYDANATAKCDSTVRCQGMCTGTAKAPECEGELTPPKCTGDVNCQGGCKAQAKLKAECTPPAVVVTGFADADFDAVLTANLPAIRLVFEQAGIVVKGAGDLATASASLIADVGNDIKCAASSAGKVAASLEASVKATASVNVSVMASASVSGSASGG